MFFATPLRYIQGSHHWTRAKEQSRCMTNPQLLRARGGRFSGTAIIRGEQTSCLDLSGRCEGAGVPDVFLSLLFMPSAMLIDQFSAVPFAI